MNLISYLSMELKKIRRSHILWILLIPIVILWIPSVVNSGMNFEMQAEGSRRKIIFSSRAFWDLPGSCIRPRW